MAAGMSQANGSALGRANQDERVTMMGRGIEIRRAGRPVENSVLRGGAVYLVIDCSGSMAGDKLAEARKGAIDFSSEALVKRYAIGMISFASEANHICEPRQELANVQRHLPGLEAGGSTNMASGIKLATVKLTGRPAPRAMVVITDGMPDHEEKALDAAREAKEQGIDIMTVGTDDADREFLEKLASRKDLVVVVKSEKLGQGITSAAGMLSGGQGPSQGPTREP